MGLGFLSLYVALLYKPNIMTENKNQIFFMLVYGGFLAIIFLIPEPLGGELAPDGTFSDAKFYLPITIYLIFFFSSAFSIVVFMSVQVFKSITDSDLVKKLKTILLLIIVYFYHVFGMVITNFINESILQNIFYGSEVIVIVVVILFYFAFRKGI